MCPTATSCIEQVLHLIEARNTNFPSPERNQQPFPHIHPSSSPPPPNPRLLLSPPLPQISHPTLPLIRQPRPPTLPLLPNPPPQPLLPTLPPPNNPLPRHPCNAINPPHPPILPPHPNKPPLPLPNLPHNPIPASSSSSSSSSIQPHRTINSSIVSSSKPLKRYPRLPRQVFHKPLVLIIHAAGVDGVAFPSHALIAAF